jgi:hypothetical protein
VRGAAIGARGLAALVLALAAPVAAAGAPMVTDPTLTPTNWSSAETSAATWTQSGFDPPQLGPAMIETRASGSASPWTSRVTLPGDLVDGANGVVGMNVADLEGRFDVRVRMPNVPGLAPVLLGTLQLDRTGPHARDPRLPPTPGVITAAWTQADAGAGSHPNDAPVAEVNAHPGASPAGAWLAFIQQPPPGDGPRLARTGSDGIAEGRHLVRVRSRDAIGNPATRVLGAVHIDRTPPAIAGVSVAPGPDPRDPVVRVQAAVSDPGDGSGVTRTTVAPAGSDDAVDWSAGGTGDGSLAVRTPGAGLHALVVRAWDAAGNRAESVPVQVRVLTDDEYRRTLAPPVPVAPDLGGPATTPPGGEPGAGAGNPPAAGVRFAWLRARAFHQRRAGLRLTARPRVVRSPAAWRALLGGANAALYAGYTAPDGIVLLGPAAAAGLEALQRARRARPATRPPSRADLDRMAMGLAVLLHESLHATGPPIPGDYHLSPSSRALEEALTEAATADLLPRYVASLGLPRALAPRMRAAATRYRPAYRPQVLWLRGLSARATSQPVRAPATVAFRVRAADRWGRERWELLSAAVSVGVLELRATIPRITRAR